MRLSMRRSGESTLEGAARQRRREWRRRLLRRLRRLRLRRGGLIGGGAVVRLRAIFFGFGAGGAAAVLSSSGAASASGAAAGCSTGAVFAGSGRPCPWISTSPASSSAAPTAERWLPRRVSAFCCSRCSCAPLYKSFGTPCSSPGTPSGNTGLRSRAAFSWCRGNRACRSGRNWTLRRSSRRARPTR